MDLGVWDDDVRACCFGDLVMAGGTLKPSGILGQTYAGAASKVFYIHVLIVALPSIQCFESEATIRLILGFHQR